jgi:four helix bundle protein
MESEDWTIRDKPYDLRERLFAYACLMVRVVRFLHTRGPIGVAFSDQVLRSGASAGANYEEADDGSSARDTLAKRKIVLRELKETRFRLRVMRHTGVMTPSQDPVIRETEELIRIVASIIRNSSGPG